MARASLLIGALLVLYFGFLGLTPLMDPDEGRYAEIPREMLADGDFVTPQLSGVPYLEKPPLYYWGTALTLQLFGLEEFGARAFGAAMAVAGVLLTYWVGAVLGGPRVGLFGALVLATAPLNYIIGRLNTIDMTVGVLLIATIFPAYLVLARGRGRGYLYAAYAGSALAFLAKGLIGILFPIAILGLWVLLRWRWRDLPRLVSPVGLGIFLALVLPWLILVQWANPDFFWFFFVREHLLRYLSTTHGRYRPFWYLLPFVPLGLLPWLPLVWRAWRATRRTRGAGPAAARGELSGDDRLLLWLWAGFILVFFSASDSKLITYIIPVFPPLSVLCGGRLAAWSRGSEQTPARLPLVLAAGLAIALITAPLVFKSLSIGTLGLGGWLGITMVPSLGLLAWGMTPVWLPRLGVQRTVLVSAALLALVWLSLTPAIAASIGAQRSGKALALAIRAQWQPGDVIAQRGTYLQSVSFYTRQLTLVVGEQSELAFGRARASASRRALSPDEATFRQLWQSERRVFCIFESGALADIQAFYPGHRLIAQSRRGILVTNR
jgi:4-amino-4-deoxy-L-arabinose transferase-like glycosyltransferase